MSFERARFPATIAASYDMGAPRDRPGGSVTRRERILATAEDAGADFVYYKRKNDEDLPRGQIESAIAAGEVTVAEILYAFCKGMKDAG